MDEFNEHNMTTRAKASYIKVIEVNANFHESQAEQVPGGGDIAHEKESIKLDLWDTAGQEAF
jgi:GTPase SAR1 family protein